jgi:exonuclease SbcC
VEGAPAAEVLVKTIEDVRTAGRLRADLQRAFQTAVADERAAREKVDEIDRRVAGLRRDCETQRDPLVSAGLDPPGIGTDLLADWESFARWAAQAAASEIDRVAAGLEERAAIVKRVASAREEVHVANELARLLRSTGFEQWIVNEALKSLVEGASATLELLSSGQYALAVDDRNEFEVVDHRNADERRPIKTLSGGETFQASTALALALADQVAVLAAGGAAKLDAIFLDEGFGSLDADSLDTVAATLETLGGDGRMVGIVTHVRELADRVPVRYEVAKGPRTSTVTRVEA